MEASTSNGSDDVKTFRGRSLEELLPQIRAELGPDAIVLRRREGLGGGVGGFFQRPYVEVDARAPHADERPLEIRSDRATVEGLSLARRPGAVRAGDAVRRRARRRRARHADGGRHVLRHGPAAAVRSRRRSPSRTSSSRRRPGSTARSRTSPRSARRRRAGPSPSPCAPPPPPVGRDADGDAAGRRRRRRGPADRRRAEPGAGRRRRRRGRRARAAVLHAAQPQEADPRRARAPDPGHDRARPGSAHDRRDRRRRRRQDDRRSPTSPPPTPRAGADVAVIALRGDGDLAHRLQPLGVGVIAADDAAQATRAPRRPQAADHADRHARHGPEPRRRARQGAGRRPEGAGRDRGPPRAAGHAQLGRGRRGRRRARPARPDARRADALRRDRAPRRAARAGAARRPPALLRVLARGRHAGRPRRARATTASMTAAVTASAPTLQPGQHVIDPQRAARHAAGDGRHGQRAGGQGRARRQGRPDLPARRPRHGGRGHVRPRHPPVRRHAERAERRLADDHAQRRRRADPAARVRSRLGRPRR